jgi:hypothetical protein
MVLTPSSESFPAVPSLLSQMLDASGQGGLGGSDHSGITLFDIPEAVPGSCLGALKPMLAAVAMKSLSSTVSSSPAFSALPSPAASSSSSASSFQRAGSHTTQATLSHTHTHSSTKIPNPSYSLGRSSDSYESKSVGPVTLTRGPTR